MGRQIIAKFPEEKQTGVERRIQEAAHDHREIDKKIRKKEEVSLCVRLTGSVFLRNVLLLRLHNNLYARPDEYRHTWPCSKYLTLLHST